MQKIATDFGAKLGVAFVSVAMLFTLATPAQAQTLEELQAMIVELQAAITALTGGGTSGSAACAFTGSLTIGSQGAQVTCLQEYLVAGNYLVMPAGVSYGYFGPLTQSAVAAWQAANGVSPAVGYFGPISQAKYNMVAGSTSGGTTGGTTGGSTTLNGGAGNIDDADFISSINNEDVGEDENDVEVLGLEIEADDGSDIELVAVTIDFDYNGSAGSDDFDDYAEEVTVWFDGNKVATVDADEFEDDNDYSRTVTLDRGAIIREGDTEDLVVAVTAQSNIDSTDLNGANNDWDVSVESVRFRDGSGAVITESNQGDISSTQERAFEFVTFASATNLELKISGGDDDINDSQLLQVEDNDQSDNVKIFSFMVEVEGNSDMTLDDLVATSTMTGTSTQLNDIFGELRLYMDGDVVGSENAPAADSVTFANLDLDLEAGEEYEFVIEVDILEYDAAGTYGLSDTVAMSIGSTERAAWDVEDEEGDNIASGDRSGTASTEAHSLTLSAVVVDGYSWTVAATGTFLDFFFTVDVDDEDFAVTQASIASTTAGTATTSVGVLSVSGDSSDVSGSAPNFTVEAGGDAQFRVRYTIGDSGSTNGDWAEVTITEVAGKQVPSSKQQSPTAIRNISS